jgi:hypothetical protein
MRQLQVEDISSPDRMAAMDEQRDKDIAQFV